MQNKVTLVFTHAESFQKQIIWCLYWYEISQSFSYFMLHIFMLESLDAFFFRIG